MTSTSHSHDDADPKDIDTLQTDIEHTREQLGQTVDALTAKLDVKTRARRRVDASRQQATAQLNTARSQAVDLAATTRDKVTDDNGAVRREAVIGAAVLTLFLGAALVLTTRRRNG